MPVRFLTDAQRERLSGFPAELDSEALDRFFTFSDADLAEISRRHGDGNRLGCALHLSGLRLLGFCPADVTTRRQGLWRSWPASSALTRACSKATEPAPRRARTTST